jgi:nucleoside-diphosphate-sugar epimerase
MNTPRTPQRPPPRPRLGRPRLLIVGCGDIGLRIVARLRGRFRLFGTSASAEGAARVRAAGATALRLDLDAPGAQARIGGLAPRVMLLAPTSRAGAKDARAPRLLRSLRRAAPARLLYASTTGVYGDRQGAWVDECTEPAPASDRARRRLDAERRLRASAWHAIVLRIPGIYGPGRLPLERLRQRIPVPLPEQDVHTNHIHADDLARACVIALLRGRPARLYNIVDDTQLTLGAYLDRVADHAGLARPPRAPWEQLRLAAGVQRMSFLGESRRLRNSRMKRELRLRLHYPDVAAGLAALSTSAPADQASKSPSTER